MRCLADNGRLLEIGKYDILKGTPLSMRPMLRNVAFEGIDLDRITNDPCNIAEVGLLAFPACASAGQNSSPPSARAGRPTQRRATNVLTHK